MTDQEMLAKQNALANVSTLDGISAWMQMRPAHVKPNYTKLQPGGRLMQAKYNGTCWDCRGPIKAGEDIRYDGHAHHAGQNTCDYWREQEQARRDRADQDRADAASLVEDMPASVVQSTFAAPHDGTYSLVWNDGTYRTLRIHTPKQGNLAGKRIAAFLRGADNDGDYTGFAFVNDNGTFNVWKRFRDNTDLRMALGALCQPERAAEAGLAYALESGNCYRCGRKLTVPTSIHNGLGPDCYKMVFGE